MELKQILEQINKLTTTMRDLVESGKEENSTGIKKINDKITELEVKMNRKLITTTSGETKYSDEQKEYSNDFMNKYVKSGIITDGLEKKAMSTDSGPTGGYIVPEQMHTNIIGKVRGLSPVRSIADIVTISSGNTFTVPVEGEEDFEAGWVGERTARPVTGEGKLELVRIDLNEMYAQPAITRWMTIDSAFNMEDYVTTKIASRLARLEGKAFVTGDGIAKPKGFLLSNKVSTINGTLGGVNQFDDLIKFQATIKSQLQVNARWTMNSKTLAFIRTIKSQQGQYLWQPGIVDGYENTILGKPYTILDDMPNIIDSAGALIVGSTGIAYGDFRAGYMIIDKENMIILRDEMTNKPFIMLYTIKRVGGDVVNNQAIKVFKIQ